MSRIEARRFRSHRPTRLGLTNEPAPEGLVMAR